MDKSTPNNPVIERDLAHAAELLKLASTRERVEALLASFNTPEHRYDPSPVRPGNARGSGKPFLVLNRENRALYATQDQDQARFYASLSNGRKVLNLKPLPAYQRAQLSNILAMPVSNTSAHPPAPRVEPFREHRDKIQEIEELLAEIKNEVAKLALPPTQYKELLSVAVNLALAAGREAALDLIFEISLLAYTWVWDLVENKLVAEFDTASEAGEFVRQLHESPDGMIYSPKDGKPTGRYRFTTVKRGYAPEVEETE
jgi:hypothetical protein